MDKKLAKQKGMLEINGFWIHQTSTVDAPVEIGKDTVIWAYTQIREKTKIGFGSTIGSHCYIDDSTIIGNGVRLRGGFACHNNVILKDRVSAGEGVIIAAPQNNEPTVIEEGVSIEDGAVILGGLHIGANAVIKEGALVTKDVSPNGVIMGYASRCVCKRPECKECSRRKK